MKLKAIEYLIIKLVVIISVKGHLPRETKIILLPTDGPTHISLNGNHIYNSTDWSNTSNTGSVNPRKDFFLSIQRQPPEEDFPIDEHYESPKIQLSPDSKTSAQKPSICRGNIISRSKRSQDCEPTLTKCACLDVCKGDLIFEENFDTLNRTTWHHEIRLASTDDFEFVSYQNRPENCYVSNGILHIVPGLLSETPNFNDRSIANGTLDLIPNCTGNIRKECFRKSLYSNILPPVVTARIRTKGSFQFRYGRVDVRAKLPKGDWLYPLILLEPVQNTYGNWNYSSGQIKIAFAAGNEKLMDSHGDDISGRVLLGGAILTAQTNLRRIQLFERTTKEHLGNDFHIYSVKWTDKNISLAIDGNEYGVVSGEFHKLFESHQIRHARLWKTGEYMAPFDQEFYITLGVAVGGHADFPDGSKNPTTGKLKPWTNMDPKEAFAFWKNRQDWLSTWKGINTGLRVDYVRVYAV